MISFNNNFLNSYYEPSFRSPSSSINIMKYLWEINLFMKLFLLIFFCVIHSSISIFSHKNEWKFIRQFMFFFPTALCLCYVIFYLLMGHYVLIGIYLKRTFFSFRFLWCKYCWYLYWKQFAWLKEWMFNGSYRRTSINYEKGFLSFVSFCNKNHFSKGFKIW